MLNVKSLEQVKDNSSILITNYRVYKTMLIYTGGFEVQFIDEHNICNKVKPNSIVLLGKNSNYTIIANRKIADIEKQVAYIDNEVVLKIIKIISSINLDIAKDAEKDISMASAQIEYPASQMIEFIMAGIDSCSNIDALPIMVSFVLMLFNDLPLVFSVLSKGKVENIADKVSNVIEEDISRAWKVSEVSHKLFMTESCLRKKLQKETLTFKKLLIDLKMKHAAILVKTTNVNIEQIAHQLGFNSTSYFIKTFREYYNATPKKFANS